MTLATERDRKDHRFAATIGRAAYESDRGRDWKLTLWKKGSGELYDLAADPYEQHDPAAEQPGVVERLADLVPPPRKRRHREHGVFAPNHKLRRAARRLGRARASP